MQPIRYQSHDDDDDDDDDDTDDTDEALNLGSLSEKKYGIFWEFCPYGGGEGSPKSQNFCDLTK